MNQVRHKSQKDINRTNSVLALASGGAVLAAILCWSNQSSAQVAVAPQSMKMLGQVDSRFLSYNVEAVEVTGGRFWAPYASMSKSATVAPPPLETLKPGAPDPRFQYRPPIDLTNPKLRKLAAALGPAYVRVSGTWRNSTYFQNDDQPALSTPPAGFQNVMTRAEWRAVVEFAHAVNGEIVASVTTSAGVRDPSGAWTGNQAKNWLDYTKSIGGRIAAIEFMNEPTLMFLGGVSDKYGAT